MSGEVGSFFIPGTRLLNIIHKSLRPNLIGICRQVQEKYKLLLFVDMVQN